MTNTQNDFLVTIPILCLYVKKVRIGIAKVEKRVQKFGQTHFCSFPSLFDKKGN
jgi:hypothetical protein